MLPFFHGVHEILADPAFDTFLLLLIVLAEVHAVHQDRLHTKIAKQTYELYRTYFEVTEKRKADAREKAAATRAAKKAAVQEPPAPPVPVPAEGEVPPPMSIPDEDPDGSGLPS